MGFFSNLFDKREKMAYRDGCGNLFNLALMLNYRFPQEFADINDADYTSDMIGILATYLDTKPEDSGRSRTFGEAAIYYGTVHGTILINTHPIQANLQDVYLPKFKQRHQEYSKFVKENMNNNINATTTRTLAGEVLRINGIPADSAKINSIAVDINTILEWVDATLSKFRLV